MELKDKLQLKPDEKLVEVSHRMKGSMQEMDIYKYEIINSSGDVVGYVDYTDHTSIRGFSRTQTATQYDVNYKKIVDIDW
ncbi:hypothetical protein A7P54_14830 [Acinetobacter sp. Ac_3412]|uniref:hypothetical protein n=1 Tax=Acinetobacter sp. Ac_3412 TaxID=1848935 RepID=UPI00148FCCF4|nr:hypothetical protein [Acinetobacter sp. Ac_3412]NNP77685.1 hypothetical protein [Acinetobacter sp. Ac_3412]